MKKTVIISGATSMLGFALLEECLKRGEHVIALIRKDSPKKKILPEDENLTIIEANIEEYAYLENDKNFLCDIFYHFAWTNTQSSQRNNPELQLKNIQYTLDAVNLAKRFGCHRFVGAGSQAEYGRVSNIISSDCPCNPETAYGISKFASGKLASILCRQLEMDFIWTRIFSVYGPHDLPSTMLMYCIKSLESDEKPLFSPSEQQWDYLYCKDAANAFNMLGDKGKPGKTYNLGSGETAALKEYIYEVRDQINPSLPLGVGENPYSSLQIMHLQADINDLTADTGFKPIYTFSEGIKETINWYESTQKRN